MTLTKSLSLVVLSLLSSFPVLSARGFVTVRFPVGGVLVTVLVALVVFLAGFGFFVLVVPKRERRATGDKTASAVQ